MQIKTLGEVTAYQREHLPDKVAMVSSRDDRSWTYSDLDNEACKVANALAVYGISSSDRVAYLDKNQGEFFTYVFGASKLNAVVVAINWRLSASEIEHVIKHSAAKTLLIGHEFLPLLEQMSIELENIVVLGEPGEESYVSYASWIAPHPSEFETVHADPEDTCLQLYTSGTTGLPKGVEIKNSNILASTGNSAPLNFTQESVSLACIPLFHIAGSAWAIAGFIQGAKNIIMEEPDLPEILRVLPGYQITHTAFVPTLMKFLLSVPTIKDIDFSNLEMIAYGASPIPKDVLVNALEVFACKFCGMYGLTETTAGITRLDSDDHDPGGPKEELLGSCGKAVNGNEIKIVDQLSGDVLPDGELGEIMIRGPQLMRGYWQDADATAAAIDADGWFKSGDAGYMRNGYLFIHDRVKDLIISGGENVYPVEVENVLRAHPAVGDVAVIGVPDDKWGETVKAFICHTDQSISADDFISYCREKIAHYKCPTSIEFIDVLPRNSAGKVLKTELRQLH